MVTLSTNAVEIKPNGGNLESELRSFIMLTADTEDFDPMLSQKYSELNQTILLSISHQKPF
jgi:phosphoribosylformylglycinamidine synthase